MLEITVTKATSASPEQVLSNAGTDFSPDRATIWTNVAVRRLEVHHRGETYIDVTEYAPGIVGFAWERSRYDWSEPGTVKQTVLGSNVLVPGRPGNFGSSLVTAAAARSIGLLSRGLWIAGREAPDRVVIDGYQHDGNFARTSNADDQIIVAMPLGRTDHHCDSHTGQPAPR